MRRATCTMHAAMQFVFHPPNHYRILDALAAAAVPTTILGLTLSFIIQALVDSHFVLKHSLSFNGPGQGLGSRLVAHLNRRIDAEPDGITPVVCRDCRYGESISSKFRNASVTTICALLVMLAASLATFTVLPPCAPILFVEAPRPVVTDLSGKVEQVYAARGDIVRIGDPILQLDMRKMLYRKQTLQSRNHSAELQGSRAELSNMYREFHQTEVELTRLTVTSTVAGRILLVVPVANDRVQAG